MSAYEYSYSNGQYWSKYNHCRVWENGTYTVKVRDEFGAEDSQEVVIDYNQYDSTPLLPPVISYGTYTQNTWTTSDVTVYVTDPNTYADDVIQVSYVAGAWSTLAGGSVTLFQTGNVRFRIYNTGSSKVSTEVSFAALITKNAPSNLSVQPVSVVSKRIDTTMSAIDQATKIRYSISYDNGAIWSTPQVGRKFSIEGPLGQTFSIKGRAYNEAGLYIESETKKITIQ